MDKEIAEEIIRENRYPSGYDIQDYLFDNEGYCAFSGGRNGAA